MSRRSAPDRLAGSAEIAPTDDAGNVALPLEFAGTALPELRTTSVGVCPLCGGTDARAFAEGFDYELETCRNRWHFVECDSCSHVRLDPRPAIESLGAIYPRHYYAYNLETRVHPLALKGKAWL